MDFVFLGSKMYAKKERTVPVKVWLFLSQTNHINRLISLAIFYGSFKHKKYKAGEFYYSIILIEGPTKRNDDFLLQQRMTYESNLMGPSFFCM